MLVVRDSCVENKLNFHIKSLVPKMFYNFKVSHTFYCGTHIKLFFFIDSRYKLSQIRKNYATPKQISIVNSIVTTNK